ncbi:MAG: hypothetical protein ACXU7H_12460, partial [Burkholderiaceae bacterium]
METRLMAMRQEIEQLDTNRLLNTSPTDLSRYLIEKYSLQAPSLRRDDWSASEQETQVDVRHDQNRWIDDRSRPCLVPGQLIEVEVPIEGEIELMYARASTFSSCAPKAMIRANSLFLVYQIPHDAPHGDIRQKIDNTLNDIDQHIGWVTNDINGFNQRLPQLADHTISERRNRILANQGRIASLGIPLKSRPDAPKTYAVPNVRRKVAPSLPPATSKAYEPEPMLDNENYNHILTVIQNMAQVMERSPSAFKGMGEEDLRQHFLVRLNGQFEGAATGETFNVNGKTDILLRANGKNVFIAECKFWKGPKHYRETIDQLLGYTAWRDTKTAILIFNRGTAMSTVLDGIAVESKAHKNCKQQVNWNHESGFRYIFHHNGDANREFILTVLVFDV